MDNTEKMPIKNLTLDAALSLSNAFSLQSEGASARDPRLPPFSTGEGQAHETFPSTVATPDCSLAQPCSDPGVAVATGSATSPDGCQAQ